MTPTPNERKDQIAEVETHTVDVWVYLFNRLTEFCGRKIIPFSDMEAAWELIQRISLAAPDRGAKGEKLFFERLDAWIRFDAVCAQMDAWYEENESLLRVRGNIADIRTKHAILTAERKYGKEPIYI